MMRVRKKAVKTRKYSGWKGDISQVIIALSGKNYVSENDNIILHLSTGRFKVLECNPIKFMKDKILEIYDNRRNLQKGEFHEDLAKGKNNINVTNIIIKFLSGKGGEYNELKSDLKEFLDSKSQSSVGRLGSSKSLKTVKSFRGEAKIGSQPVRAIHRTGSVTSSKSSRSKVSRRDTAPTTQYRGRARVLDGNVSDSPDPRNKGGKSDSRTSNGSVGSVRSIASILTDASKGTTERRSPVDGKLLENRALSEPIPTEEVHRVSAASAGRSSPMLLDTRGDGATSVPLPEHAMSRTATREQSVDMLKAGAMLSEESDRIGDLTVPPPKLDGQAASALPKPQASAFAPHTPKKPDVLRDERYRRREEWILLRTRAEDAERKAAEHEEALKKARQEQEALMNIQRAKLNKLLDARTPESEKGKIREELKDSMQGVEELSSAKASLEEVFAQAQLKHKQELAALREAEVAKDAEYQAELAARDEELERHRRSTPMLKKQIEDLRLRLETPRDQIIGAEQIMRRGVPSTVKLVNGRVIVNLEALEANMGDKIFSNIYAGDYNGLSIPAIIANLQEQYIIPEKRRAAIELLSEGSESRARIEGFIRETFKEVGLLKSQRSAAFAARAGKDELSESEEESLSGSDSSVSGGIADSSSGHFQSMVISTNSRSSRPTL